MTTRLRPAIAELAAFIAGIGFVLIFVAWEIVV